VYDGPIVHQAEEVAWGRFMPLAQVAAFARENPVVPDGAEIFREYLRRFGAPPSS